MYTCINQMKQTKNYQQSLESNSKCSKLDLEAHFAVINFRGIEVKSTVKSFIGINL